MGSLEFSKPKPKTRGSTPGPPPKRKGKASVGFENKEEGAAPPPGGAGAASPFYAREPILDGDSRAAAEHAALVKTSQELAEATAQAAAAAADAHAVLLDGTSSPARLADATVTVTALTAPVLGKKTLKKTLQATGMGELASGKDRAVSESVKSSMTAAGKRRGTTGSQSSGDTGNPVTYLMTGWQTYLRESLALDRTAAIEPLWNHYTRTVAGYAPLPEATKQECRAMARRQYADVRESLARAPPASIGAASEMDYSATLPMVQAPAMRVAAAAHHTIRPTLTAEELMQQLFPR